MSTSFHEEGPQKYSSELIFANHQSQDIFSFPLLQTDQISKLTEIPLNEITL